MGSRSAFSRQPRKRTERRISLLALVLGILLVACGSPPADEEAEREPAFDSYEEALRHYRNVQRFFPDARPPAALVAMAPPEDDEGEPPEPEEGEEEEESEEEGPNEVPRPEDPEWHPRGTSGNWAGAPKGPDGECPCESDFSVNRLHVYLDGDPRSPEPGGNGVYRNIWEECLAQVPVPQDGPEGECPGDCDWVTRGVKDWSLKSEAGGTWRLTCWKILVHHCDLESEDITAVPAPRSPTGTGASEG